MVIALFVVGVVVYFFVRVLVGYGQPEESMLERHNRRQEERGRGRAGYKLLEVRFQQELAAAHRQLKPMAANVLAQLSVEANLVHRMAAMQLLRERTMFLSLAERVALYDGLVRRYRDFNLFVRDSSLGQQLINEIEDGWEHLHELYPNLYDMQLLCYAELVPAPKPWFHLPASRLSGDDRFLEGPIEYCIGYLGPKQAPFSERVPLLELWDEAQRRIRAADIEELHVVGGHGSLPYDWAVNATVEMLHNRLGSDVKLPVHLVGGPALSGNSLRMLESVASEIKQEA